MNNKDKQKISKETKEYIKNQYKKQKYLFLLFFMLYVLIPAILFYIVINVLEPDFNPKWYILIVLSWMVLGVVLWILFYYLKFLHVRTMAYTIPTLAALSWIFLTNNTNIILRLVILFLIIFSVILFLWISYKIEDIKLQNANKSFKNPK